MGLGCILVYNDKLNISQLASLFLIARSTKDIRNDLAEWEPVGSILERIRGAMNNVDSVTEKDIKRLHEFQRRWSSINPVLRDFYRDNIKNESVSCVVWYLLIGEPNLIKDNTESSVKRLYREQVGYDCPYSMFPKIL